MKFNRIEVEDIFAYRGPSEIDLSTCDDERNIVVVQGQNGFGKTSLLNAIKLLFLGSENEGIRRVGFGGAILNRKHFVLGHAGRWYGVFNTEARDLNLPARVALEWEDGGRAYRAERLFFVVQNGADFREQLNVTLNRQPLGKEAAEAALLNLVPKEAVPFFFFDGEQIQSIADADVGRERAEIERLLGLSFISVLTREIDVYGRDKRRAALPETVQGQIRTAEAHQTAAETRAAGAQRARVQLEEEILEQETAKRRLDAERNALRGGVSEAERKRTDARIEMLQLQREKLARQIAEALPAEAPALANLPLTRRSFAMLEEQLSGAADVALAGRLHRELPDALVGRLGAQEPPVPLTDGQASRFREDVRQVLVDKGVPAKGHENALFASLSPKRLQILRDRFLVWDNTGAVLVASQVGWLRQARLLAREEQQLRQEIEDAEITSDEARARYVVLTKELDEIEGGIRERIESATEHRLEEQRAQKEAAQYAQTVAALYAEHERTVKINAELVVSRRARAALERFREERRKQIRASVEAALNRRVELLLGPSQLVKSVRLDNQFAVTYYDSAGDLIARHSMSAGMRQLAAMAMLWALKDEAQRPLPVVIDTPLGRIDRENRAILMSDYFPQAGNPLILLPTNTELSEDDLAVLSPRIGGRYAIRNDGGPRARLEPLGASARV